VAGTLTSDYSNVAAAVTNKKNTNTTDTRFIAAPP
jgi:hypothetical protein